MAVSFISNKEIKEGEAISGKEIRAGIFQLIKSQHSGFDEVHFISLEELNRYRRLYLTKLIEQEKGELAAIDHDVMEAIRTNSILTETIKDDTESELTTGQKMADRIATFGGSWTFIIFFFLFILLWMAVNVFYLTVSSFDPYPFILLNLILSCLAAIQAPIIMMSQNRQEQKDRIRAEHDYKINLKAELEIKLLSEKIDHLLVNQNKKLLEIQEVQIDYLEDLMKKK
ncbi:MAG: DUF1003 domain-containing protein [Ferruginibacter sp.]|nr:DUF1003 domain-containing protein [Ferruginibacter sp.]